MYNIKYKTNGDPAVIAKDDCLFIPITTDNSDFREFLQWNAKQIQPLDYQTPIEVNITEPDSVNFNLPVVAPDFIVATPPINPNPDLALDEAIAEMEKGAGVEKSIALIALSLAKYLKSKQAKLK